MDRHSVSMSKRVAPYLRKGRLVSGYDRQNTSSVPDQQQTRDLKNAADVVTGEPRDLVTDFVEGFTLPNGIHVTPKEHIVEGRWAGGFTQRGEELDRVAYENRANTYHFYLDRDDSALMCGEALYLPENMRGKGTAKQFAAAQEELARQIGCERFRRTPGNRNGGVFWTLQGYDWEHIDDYTNGEFVQLGHWLENPEETPRTWKGQHEFRFEPIVSNWNHVSQYADELKQFTNKAQEHQWLGRDERQVAAAPFYAKDVLAVGRDKPFKCQLTGRETWAGAVVLSHAGGWHAYKNL